MTGLLTKSEPICNRSKASGKITTSESKNCWLSWRALDWLIKNANQSFLTSLIKKQMSLSDLIGGIEKS